MFPNTFVAGAQKSGTTTLCNALASHPQVIVSQPKEPIFFSKAANLARLELYEACFQQKPGAEPRAVIDGSNAYMSDPAVASRIRETLGSDLQFIFSLRDPLSRMVSAYWHQAKKAQDRRSLVEALCIESDVLYDAVREEDQRLQRAVTQGLLSVNAYAESYDDPLWNFRYLRNSLYAADLRRFQNIFGAERIMVVLFEDFVKKPLPTLNQLASFLDLDPEAFPSSLDLHLNPTRLPRAQGLLATLRRLPGIASARRVPGYALISHALFYRRPDSAPAEFTARYRRLFAPEMAQLQQLLGRDLVSLW